VPARRTTRSRATAALRLLGVAILAAGLAVLANLALLGAAEDNASAGRLSARGVHAVPAAAAQAAPAANPVAAGDRRDGGEEDD
jgi:hypothetical protein